MKIYVAGPMSGYPEHNFPAFQEATRILRGRGYEVISPAELDLNEVSVDHEALAKVPWDWYLRRDIKLLVDCDGVFLLPGWSGSRGAMLERHIALALGMTIIDCPIEEVQSAPA